MSDKDKLACHAKTYNLIRGGTGGATDADIVEAARNIAADPTASAFMRELAEKTVEQAGKGGE